MSDPFRNAEEASDARFNVPYPTEEQIDRGGFGEGSTPQAGAFVPPFGQVLTAAAAKIEAFKDSELSFSFPHTGGVFTRMARSSVEDFGNLDLIDLRTLRAHLEEASFLITNAILQYERQR